MKCERCEAKLNYKDRYCNACGEKVDIKGYEQDYNKTVWGIIDKISDWLEIIQLKKIADHWITKTLVIIAVLGWGVFDVYTEFTNIRLLESENYKIEYNKKLDEYYIRTSESETNVNLYIPGHADKINVKEYLKEEIKNETQMFPEDLISTPVTIKKGEYDYIIIDSLKEGRTTDTVKLYITE